MTDRWDRLCPAFFPSLDVEVQLTLALKNKATVINACVCAQTEARLKRIYIVAPTQETQRHVVQSKRIKGRISVAESFAVCE